MDIFSLFLFSVGLLSIPVVLAIQKCDRMTITDRIIMTIQNVFVLVLGASALTACMAGVC
jgi:hypothetical protein